MSAKRSKRAAVSYGTADGRQMPCGRVLDEQDGKLEDSEVTTHTSTNVLTHHMRRARLVIVVQPATVVHAQRSRRRDTRQRDDSLFTVLGFSRNCLTPAN